MMKSGLMAAVAMGALLPAIAQAQDAGTEVVTSNDIIVTAQRREENLQDVPIAVTVFDDKERDRLGIRTITDMANVTPGLSFNAQLDRLSLRGVGRLTNIIGSDPGVAVYNDGLYTSSNAEASKSPMFVANVQILRGPQGTLFGRNSVGGAINVISKRPTEEWGGEVRLSADKYSGYVAEGFVSGPVTDSLKARLSVQFGPRPIREAFDNIGPGGDVGSLKRFLIEGQIQWDIAEDVELWMKYSHSEWNQERYGITNLVTPYSTSAFFPSGALVPNAGYGYATPNPGVTDFRTVNMNTTNQDNLSKNHNFVVNFKAALSDDVELNYVGGYSQYLYELQTDLDWTSASRRTDNLGSLYGSFTWNPTYIQDYVEDKNYYSNEITLSNRGTADRFNWVLGAYQYREHFYQPITWRQGGDGTDNMARALANPICLTATFGLGATCEANPDRLYYRGTGDLRINSYAGFGQADYKVTDNLKVTAGLRYSSDKKVGAETYRLVGWNPVGSAYCTLAPFGVIGFGNCGPLTAGQDLTRYVLQIPGSGTAARSLRGTFDGWSWRLGADMTLSDRAMVYASYNRGLKAGGFNLGSYALSPLVENEKVDAFEVGLKSSPADGLTFNTSAFYYDYRNAQVPIAVPLGSTGLNTTNFFNIDKSRSLGLEIETRWQATPQFDLTATYSYLDATIRKAPRTFDDPNAPGTVLIDLAGKRSPTTSKHKLYLAGLYDLPVGESHLLFAASYTYRSNAYYDVFNAPTGRAPGWSQVDGRITYVDASEQVTIIGYVRNVFNSRGYVGAAGNGGTSAAGFGQLYAYTPPRQIGAEVQFRF